MKKRILIAIIAVLFAFSASACGGKTEKADGQKEGKDKNKNKQTHANVGLKTTFKDEPILEVDGEKLNLSEANIMIHNIKRLYPAEYFLEKYDEKQTLEEHLIDRLKLALAEKVYIIKTAKAEGITLTDADKKELEENLNMAFEREMITQADVDKYGITRDNFRKFAEVSYLRKGLFDKKAADVEVAEGDVAKELDNDSSYKKIMSIGKDKFKDKVTVKHILILTIDPKTNKKLSDEKVAEAKKKILEVQKKLKDGEEFGKLVKEYSEDTESIKDEGQYTFGRNEMLKEFEDASFKLNKDEVSDVVETASGFHLIKCIEKHLTTPEDIKATDEEIDVIKKRIENSLKFRKYEAEFQEKVKKADIKVIEEGWKKVKILSEEDKKNIKKRQEEKAKKEKESKKEEPKKDEKPSDKDKKDLDKDVKEDEAKDKKEEKQDDKKDDKKEDDKKE